MRGPLCSLRLESAPTSPRHVKLELIAHHRAAIGALVIVIVEGDDRGGIAIAAITMTIRMEDGGVASQGREMSVDSSTDLTVGTAIVTVVSRSIATIAKTTSYPLRRRLHRSTAAGQGRRTGFWSEKRPGSSPSGGRRRRHAGSKRRPTVGTNALADGVATAHIEWVWQRASLRPWQVPSSVTCL